MFNVNTNASRAILINKPPKRSLSVGLGHKSILGETDDETGNTHPNTHDLSEIPQMWLSTRTTGKLRIDLGGSGGQLRTRERQGRD